MVGQIQYHKYGGNFHNPHVAAFKWANKDKKRITRLRLILNSYFTSKILAIRTLMQVPGKCILNCSLRHFLLVPSFCGFTAKFVVLGSWRCINCHPFMVYMAVVPICYKIPCKDHTLSTRNSARQHERGLLCACFAIAHGGSYLSISSDVQRNWPVIYTTADVLVKVKTRGRTNASKGTILNQGLLKFQSVRDVPHLHKIHRTSRENLSVACCASKSGTNEKQLRLLDSYFGKLQDNVSEPSADSCNERTDFLDTRVQINVKEELEYLNAYLDKLDKDANLENNVSSTFNDEATEENPIVKPISVSKESRRDNEERLRSFRKLRNQYIESGSRRSEALEQNYETSYFYLIGTLASINIAVFLFEIASPVRNSEFALFSLPLLYGAKINDLILVGEWWRLVTPMFLVQD
ncbi:hypothetical protein H0E87_027971 [Populus deltoides]|uniref:Uncharacterized protein n=1 Tax=Populus deltoides TaxID=3696 RepID=A0A8T2WTC1_POPDE|nr:hypothetical protein H0E87_027971 [Populus deltoides]KAH8483382.1 hypothetical protein H0E87_027971 [Populus deltoides]KAH8483383.1 hypothetical protein H0E87_027971 [Populus deltoides]